MYKFVQKFSKKVFKKLSKIGQKVILDYPEKIAKTIVRKII